jgi:uncharacterized protein
MRRIMKIDVWTHILTPAYLHHLQAAAGDTPGPSTFLLANRALHDLDYRFQIMDMYGEYRQVLTPIPGPHILLQRDNAGQRMIDLVRQNNEEMARITRQHPDRFAGFAAATPIFDPAAATREAICAVRELGALGVQLEEDAAEFPLHDDRYDPLFAAMEDLGAGVWLHPFRTPASPGYPKEVSPFLLWQVFGWVFDTTITVARLVLAGIFDRHPRLKLIVHHGGALVPHFSGRIEMMPFYTKLDVTMREALERLKKSPIDYFKMLYVDTAMFGCAHGVRSVIDFFGPEQVMFGTDTPFDTKGGAHFIPVTISDIEAVVMDESGRSKIFDGTGRRVLNIGS